MMRIVKPWHICFFLMSSAVTNLFKVINECFQSNLKIKTHFSNIDDHMNLEEKQVYSLDRVCTKNCLGP